MLNQKFMKRMTILLGIIISILALQTVFGQETGVITYEVKMNLHRNIPKEREGMKAMVPEFRTSKQQLFFNANESLYKPLIEDEEEDINASHGGGQVVMRFQQPNEEIYFNQSESKAISSREFMGKQYLITDSLKVSPWKFGTETKTIQGYECKMAYFTDESRPDQKREITAWFTDKLRPFLAPERFHSLPGSVLAVDINNGERTIVAKTIEFRALKKSELKVPTKGQAITQSEFRKMMDEQMQKMRQGGGNLIIRN
jgi:GLPGLI family protein